MNNRTFLIEKGETMVVWFTVSFRIGERACGRFFPCQCFNDFTPAGGNCRVKKTLARVAQNRHAERSLPFGCLYEFGTASGRQTRLKNASCILVPQPLHIEWDGDTNRRSTQPKGGQKWPFN
jgi:hypothetical protein